MRPTGNCSPALLERLTAFLAVLPLPRPDMVARFYRCCGLEEELASEVTVCAELRENFCSEHAGDLALKGHGLKGHGFRGMAFAKFGQSHAPKAMSLAGPRGHRQ